MHKYQGMGNELTVTGVGLWSCLENMALKYIQNLVDF